MDYRSIPLLCECGPAPALIHDIGLTVNHQLLVQYQCESCGKEICLVKPLADCWRDCPTQAELAEAELALAEALHAAALSEPDFRSEDAAFLKSLGIRFGGNEPG